MKNVLVLAMLIAALVGGCGGGGGAKIGGTATEYAVSVLPMGPLDGYSEGWFVDNRGRTIGYVSRSDGPGGLAVWQGSAVPQPLVISHEAASGIIRQIQWSQFAQPVSDQNRAVYVTDESSGIVDLLTGATVTLPSPPGTGYSQPRAVNDAGVCVGACYRDAGQGYPVLAVVWSASGQPRLLATPAGCDRAEANSINNLGQIVGVARGEDYPNTGHVVVWNSDGSIAREVPLMQEQEVEGASGLLISDNGYIMIGQPASQPRRWYLMSPNGDIRPLAWGIMGDRVSAMNSRGQVVGYRAGGPVIWNPDSTVVKLPLPFEGASCMAWDISDSGVVVGSAQSQDPTYARAVKWTPIR